MTDVPSNRTNRFVKALGGLSAKTAHDPRARRVMQFHDNRRDFDALADCITDGMNEAGGLDESEEVVMIPLL